MLTSMKIKGKGFQHCVKYEFQPRKVNWTRLMSLTWTLSRCVSVVHAGRRVHLQQVDEERDQMPGERATGVQYGNGLVRLHE